MSYRFFFLLLGLLGVFSCSSPQGRAPVFDLTSSTAKKSTTTTSSKKKPININQKKYTVQAGDTLYGISWRAGLDIESLIKLNKIKKPYIIKKGQVLQLVADKTSKTTEIKVTKSKGDLNSQNRNKNTDIKCKSQNCSKNQTKEVAQEKTKAYSNDNNNKKTITKKSELVQGGKVNDWSWPVKGKVSKQFLASTSAMQGISIVNKRSTPIYAAATGKVVYAGNGLRGYGNLIIIKHNDDYLSAYAHNERLLVQENDEITMKQVIAEMGDSGSDHVHLHFEIRYQGKSVDPLRYLPKR